MKDVIDQTLRHVLPFGKECRKKSVKATSGAICYLYTNTLPGKKTNKKQFAIWINIANT